MLSYWGTSLLLLTFTQHLQYKTEMETGMVCDSSPQMQRSKDRLPILLEKYTRQIYFL
jgi:hypothetical protein